MLFCHLLGVNTEILFQLTILKYTKKDNPNRFILFLTQSSCKLRRLNYNFYVKLLNLQSAKINYFTVKNDIEINIK